MNENPATAPDRVSVEQEARAALTAIVDKIKLERERLNNALTAISDNAAVQQHLCPEDGTRTVCSVCCALQAVAECNALISHFEDAATGRLALGSTLTFAPAEAEIVCSRSRGLRGEIEVALIFREHLGFDGWRHGAVSSQSWREGRCLLNGHANLPIKEVVLSASTSAPSKQEIDIAWFPQFKETLESSHLAGAPPIFCEVKEGAFFTAHVVDIDGDKTLDDRFESLLTQLERYKKAAQHWFDEQQRHAYIVASTQAVSGILACASNRDTATSPSLSKFGSVNLAPCPPGYLTVHRKYCSDTTKLAANCYLRQLLRLVAEGTPSPAEGCSLYKPIVVAALLGGYSQQVKEELNSRGILCFSGMDDFATNVLPLLQQWHGQFTATFDKSHSCVPVAEYTTLSAWMPLVIHSDVLNLDQSGLCLLISDILCNERPHDSSNVASNSAGCESSAGDKSDDGEEFMVKTAINWHDASSMGARRDLMTVGQVQDTCNWFRSFFLTGSFCLVVVDDVARRFEAYLWNMGSTTERQRWERVVHRDTYQGILSHWQRFRRSHIYIAADDTTRSHDCARLSTAIWDSSLSPDKNISSFHKYESAGHVQFLDFGFDARILNCTAQHWAMARMGAMLLPDINLAHTYMPAVEGEVWHRVRLICKICGCIAEYKSTHGGRKVAVGPGAIFSKSRVRVIMAEVFKVEGRQQIVTKSRHRFIYHDSASGETANWLHKDTGAPPREIEDPDSICKQCQALQRQNASHVARHKRSQQKWFLLTKRLINRAPLRDNLMDFWRVVHFRDRVAALRAVLSGKRRAAFTGAGVSQHTVVQATDNSSSVPSRYDLRHRARSNLARAKRVLRERIDEFSESQASDNPSLSDLTSGQLPFDLFGVAMLWVAIDMTTAVTVCVDDKEEVDASQFSSWIDVIQASGFSCAKASCAMQTHSMAGGIFDVVSDQNLCMKITPAGKYTYDETQHRCTVRGIARPVATTAMEAVAAVAASGLFSAATDDNW